MVRNGLIGSNYLYYSASVLSLYSPHANPLPDVSLISGREILNLQAHFLAHEANNFTHRGTKCRIKFAQIRIQ